MLNPLVARFLGGDILRSIDRLLKCMCTLKWLTVDQNQTCREIHFNFIFCFGDLPSQ